MLLLPAKGRHCVTEALFMTDDRGWVLMGAVSSVLSGPTAADLKLDVFAGRGSSALAGV